MAIEDYFDPYEYDDDDRNEDATCRYCGANNLTWNQLPDGRWRLLNPSGRIHFCKPYRATRVASPDDFEDLTKC